MARIRSNNVFGTTTNDPLLVGGTTLSAAGLANLGVVAAPDTAVITLDPNRVAGAPEIVFVTVHTASATSATITPGAFGTAAREHAAGTEWVHGPVGKVSLDAGDFPTRVGVSLRRAAVQSFTDNTQTVISWDTEDFDSDGFIAVTGTTVTVPAGLGGMYAITAQGTLASEPNDSYLFITAAGVVYFNSPASLPQNMGVSIVIPLADAATVTVTGLADTTGAAVNFTGRLHMYRIGD